MQTARDYDQKYNYLMKENGIIRRGLREMNQFLSKFIEYVKDLKLKKLHGMEYKYGKSGKLKKNTHDKMKQLEAEAVNYDHMLGNMAEEHMKQANRMKLVTDYKYVLQLREEVRMSKEHIINLNK